MRYWLSIILFLIAEVTVTLGGPPDTGSTSASTTIYDRPFVLDYEKGQLSTAVGGYLEGNTNYFVEKGVTEGFSMEMRRFNIFMHSQLGKKIRFISELEFEHGTEEIALETALLDFEWHPALNFRAGVILPALGRVNTDHDSPKWEFVERPLSSTALIPTTLSEIGMGLHGSFYLDAYHTLSYDIYVINGIQEDIILNEKGRTYIPAGKNPSMLGEDNNGSPMINGRLGYRYRGIGKIGIAYYGGVYNTFKKEGKKVAPRRFLHLSALDFTLEAFAPLQVKGELVYANIDVPQDIAEIYGREQYGGFIDIISPIIDRKMLGFENARINASLRLEKVDFHGERFSTNISLPVGDENAGIAAGLSFRPRRGTVIRANYRYHWIVDNIGNPPVHRAGFQFGVASYF